jgi:hypothetical protein
MCACFAACSEISTITDAVVAEPWVRPLKALSADRDVEALSLKAGKTTMQK